MGARGALAALLLLAVRMYLGAFVLGLFVYYAVRPVDRRTTKVVESPGLAATATLLLVALPLLALIGYLASRLVVEMGTLSTDQFKTLVQPYVDVSTLAQNPRELVSMLRSREALQVGSTTFAILSSVLIQSFIALTFVFFLLRDDYRLADWFRSEIGGQNSAVYAYFSAVDRDLEAVYLGNTLTALAIGLLAVVTYNGYNLVAPAGLSIPFPTALALLTGVASFVPIVVGKLVYVPVSGYLSWLAIQGEGSLMYPVGLFVVSLVILDVIPQTFVQPYVAGRTIHVGLTVFAYILGPSLFGWYGLFLGPLLMVLMVQFVRIVFTELIHHKHVTPRVNAAEGLGSDPKQSSAGAFTEE
ncbi:AI-2E family transporter [Haladaptatus sp. GCM10025707]|uniref:AI-2E family transporter n=1 Tax=unclassified Haladaptatus TaxID=2622732 RepID=UPI00360904FE